MRMGLCLFHGVLRTHQGSDLLVKLIRGMQIGVQDNPLFPPMAPHHSLTCGLDALGPFPIEGSCCPEMNCRLPPGHDTVKGLPKGKPRTWSQLQGLQLPPASPSVRPPLPKPCLLPCLSKQDEGQGSSRHQGCQHTQDHRHPGCAAVGSTLPACGRQGQEAARASLIPRRPFRIFQ